MKKRFPSAKRRFGSLLRHYAFAFLPPFSYRIDSSKSFFFLLAYGPNILLFKFFFALGQLLFPV